MRYLLGLILCLWASLASAFSPGLLATVTSGSASGGSCTGISGNNAASSANRGGADFLCIIQQVDLGTCTGAAGTMYADILAATDNVREATYAIYADDGSDEPTGSPLWSSGTFFDAATNPHALHGEVFTGQSFTGKIWLAVCVQNFINQIYDTAATGGRTRSYANASYALPDPWPAASDTHRTWNMRYYIEF